MSLRDALLSKGLVSKKDADRVNRELREQRKAEQADRERKHVEVRAAEEEAKRTLEARLGAQREVRLAEAAAREAHELRYRVRQIVDGNRLGGRGPVPFYYRVGDSKRIGRLMLPEPLARELRNGDAAIAGYPVADGAWRHFVVSRRAAEKLAAVDRAALAHWNEDTAHLGDPSEALLRKDWEMSLGPHRVPEAAVDQGATSAT